MLYHALFHPEIAGVFTCPSLPVLALLLSVDGYSVEREAVDKMVAACDAGGYTPVDLDTLFTRDPLCTVREFEEWVKRHSNLSSFTK